MRIVNLEANLVKSLVPLLQLYNQLLWAVNCDKMWYFNSKSIKTHLLKDFRRYVEGSKLQEKKKSWENVNLRMCFETLRWLVQGSTSSIISKTYSYQKRLICQQLSSHSVPLPGFAAYTGTHASCQLSFKTDLKADFITVVEERSPEGSVSLKDDCWYLFFPSQLVILIF